MKLDLSKLEMVTPRGSDIIARCPACAESGNDRKGEHLYVNKNGQFGCVLHPSMEGINHRKRIFELVGIYERRSEIKIRRRPTTTQQPIIKDVLGLLGRLNLTLAYSEKSPSKDDASIHKESKPSVPNVPDNAFTSEELVMLKDIDDESLLRIAEVKRLFNGTVVKVTDTKP